MANRRTEKEAANRSAHGTEHSVARKTGRTGLDVGSHLHAQTRSFVVAARRVRNPWSIVRMLRQASVAAGRLDSQAHRQLRSAAPPVRELREHVRPALSLAQAVGKGSRATSAVRESRGVEPNRVHAVRGASGRGSDWARDGGSRGRHSQHPSETQPRARQYNPDFAMADAVRRATDADRRLAGREREAIGLAYGIHHQLARSWWSAHRLSKALWDMREALRNKRAGALEASPATREREAVRSRAAQVATAARINGSLSRFVGSVGVVTRHLRSTAMHTTASRLRAGASGSAADHGDVSREGSVRLPLVPLVIAAPAVGGAASRRRPTRDSSASQVVINSSPTVVVNSADSGLELDQRLLEVLRKHRDALYDQWHRELEKLRRTEF